MGKKKSKKKAKNAPLLFVLNPQQQDSVSVSVSGLSEDGRRLKTKTTVSAVTVNLQPELPAPVPSQSAWDDNPPIEIHNDLSGAVVVTKLGRTAAKRYENSVSYGCMTSSCLSCLHLAIGCSSHDLHTVSTGVL